MTTFRALHHDLDASAGRRPDWVALETSERACITYRELAILSDRVRDRLRHLGVRPGDRVGLCCPKSIDAVAFLLGVLKAGAAYVPCDPQAPAARNAYILADCAVTAVLVEESLAAALGPELRKLGAEPALLTTQGAGDGSPLAAALTAAQDRAPAVVVDSWNPGPDELAYILYTSGSTGRPKGVILSHGNAISFIDWCSSTFTPAEDERFSSHAPLHFDLSILDLYVPLKHAATIVLIGSELGKEPRRLASLIAERRLTSWYSAPSILSLLVQYGDLAGKDFSALRRVLFAGEVFPVRYLRDLQSAIPHARYFNLYGPTETNVCTFHEIPSSIPPERTDPYPIGKVCSHCEARVVNAEGRDVPRGGEGELCIAGPAVTAGYWKLEAQTSRAFLFSTGGTAWYRTGDVVVEDAAGDYVYRGRRDRMVKKRGYRVELGEIEVCLYRYHAVRQAAVIAEDGTDGVRIKAFVSSKDGQRLSSIALKTFCSQHLPPYMVPDLFEFAPSLPTTSTDKIDYQQLKQRSATVTCQPG
jgi:amino acid adenylation domain-containing protein